MWCYALGGGAKCRLVICRYAGAHTAPEKAVATSRLVAAIREEMLAQGDTHVVLAGDLNAEPQDLPALWGIPDGGRLEGCRHAPDLGTDGHGPHLLRPGSFLRNQEDVCLVGAHIWPAVAGVRHCQRVHFPRA